MQIKLPSGITFFERGWLSSNNVLLHDAEQAVLIDTGYWSHAQQTVELLTSALQDRPLTKIINTHLHSDHCGGNSLLQQVYPNVETLIPPGHAEFVKNWNPYALSYTPTGQHCPKFLATNIILDSQEFTIAGNSWKIHAAPGHDPNSIILFCKKHGVLISADALWQRGFGVVFPELEDQSAFDEVESTLNLIDSLSPQIVIPGHGSIFDNVTESIAYARQRLANFRTYPERHINYAAKVLLKFKLLELQQISFNELLAWARVNVYLNHIHRNYFNKKSFEDWIINKCTELETNGALIRNGQILVNA